MNTIGHNKKILGDVYKRQDCANLSKHFHKIYFELIDSFMSGKPYFNPSHFTGFT
jgi:hypothetical protein